jgi:hypothetical protein
MKGAVGHHRRHRAVCQLHDWKNYPLQAGAPPGWRGAAIWRPTQLSGRDVTVDCQSRKAMPLWLKEKLCTPDTLIPN